MTLSTEDSTRSGWKRFFGRKAEKAKPAIMPVYYEAALRLGAVIATTDDLAVEAEYKALANFFKITEEKVPGARAVYDKEVAKPSRVPTILRNLKMMHTPGAAALETFVSGMCRVALADDEVHRREAFLLKRAAEYLGFEPKDRVRILLAAGLSEDDIEGFFQHEYRRSTDDSDETWQRAKGNEAQDIPLVFISDRARDCAVLGVEPSAAPSEIKLAYRTLAKKFHPDILIASGLPDAELKRAEDTMQKINAAYEALTD